MFPEIIAGVAAAGAAGGVFAYGAAAAKSQLFGTTFFGAPGASKQIALTYDDGPNDPWTGKLLDVLDKHSVRATFFLIGKYVEMRPEIARAVAQRGHVVGNHTFSHPNLIFTSQNALRGELERTEAVITQAIGQHSRLFRPPFGARRPATLRVARAIGLEPILWSVKCWDWTAPSADYIVEKARQRIRGGDVVLLHDGGHVAFGAGRGHTVEASDELIRRYKGEGYEFVTVPEMQTALVP
ncbi:MAG: polysaccharide deacetylase family protein [Candidatus Koribacter versatilis]|uniref:Polysaccharide deacetylase family protein n=1 Tax=Candidatus Korobacter versatilis TaxID=658062 RepID=A0A932A7A9_9BACT|nr:polysaccharide deacetylase family protein [Candidatus Koribacter versatilis]